MSTIEDLLNDLANFDAQADHDNLLQIRQAIVDQYPESEHAAEAQYKIGLDFLFRQQDIMAAIECFKAAVKNKDPLWSPAARTSMGLCLYHRGEVQKALFELRKDAYPDAPTPNSITALTFIEIILEDTNKKDEAKRVRKDRINQLKKILKQIGTSDLPARAHFLHQLGMEHLRDGDIEAASQLFNEAISFGEEAIGKDLYATLKSFATQ